MEIGGCQEIDLEFEGHDLIDNYHFPDTEDATKEVNSLGIDVNDHLPELHESAEPERNQKNGRYNLRKSLAWDSAFFTSAGVLDAEELSSMIIKTDKKEKHTLPRIQEEISASTESISTLQSDCLTLESFEDDLFLDIRASIQRSSKKACNFTKSSIKIPATELDGPAISSPMKKDFVFQNKSPKPVVKKTSGLQAVRISKSQLKPIAKLSSGRPIKQGSVQSQAGPTGKIGGTNSGLPKTIGSPVPSSTAAKRESVGTGRVRPECGSSKQGSISGKGTQLPKVSTLGGSRKVLTKPAVPSKSSSLGSLTTSSVHPARSSTSSDNSSNTSTGNAAKPTLMTARRNVGGKSSNISTGPSASIPKTPSRVVPKKKLPASSLSAYLKSTKIPSSVSPSSSISEWSSASSTSSVVKQRSSLSRSSLDTISSCRSVDGDGIRLDPRDDLAGQKAKKQENKGAVKPTSTSNTSKKTSAESGTLQAPVKPSGLRLPSPKIGFFDGSSSRTPNGHQRSQSDLPPKNAAAASTPTRSSNGKLKSAKVPTAKMATSLANIKSGSPKAASPASSQEKSHAWVEASGVSMDVNDSSSLSLGLKGSGTGENCQRTLDVEAENNILKSAKVPTPRKATSSAKIKSASPKAASPAFSPEKSHALEEASSVPIDVNDSSSVSLGIKGSGTRETCLKAVEVKAENVKLKIAQVPTARMDTSSVNIKSASPKAASPASSQEKSHALEEASSVPIDVNDSFNVSLGIKGSGTGETCLKAVEVETENYELKIAQVPTARMDTSSANMKFGSPKAASPASSQEKSHAWVEASGVSMDVNDSSSLSLGLKGSGTRENCQKTLDVEAENNILKSAKVPTPRKATSSAKIKSASPKAASPAFSPEKSHALEEASSVLIDVNDSSSVSLGIEGSGTREPCLKAVEVETENNELKIAQVPTARMDTSSANMKFGSPKAASPASSQEEPHALVKASIVSMDANDSSSLSFRIEGSATGESFQKAVEVEGENDKLKIAHVPTARMDTCSANMKSCSPMAASPASSQEESHASVIPSSVTMNPNDTSSLSFGVEDSETGEICQEAVAENCVEQEVVDASTGSVNKDNLGELSLTGNMSSGDIETPTGEGYYTSGSEYISQIGDGILIKVDNLKKHSVPNSEAIEKENDPAHCQVEGLTGDERVVYKKNQEPKCQLLSDKSASVVAACRLPFALKNFSCSNEFADKPTEQAFQVAENTGYVLPSSIEKENC